MKILNVTDDYDNEVNTTQPKYDEGDKDKNSFNIYRLLSSILGLLTFVFPLVLITWKSVRRLLDNKEMV